MKNRVFSFLKKILNSTPTKGLQNNFKELLIWVISLLFLFFCGYRTIPNDDSFYVIYIGWGLVIIVALVLTYFIFKTILIKWIWDSYLVKRILNHCADFRYVWVILLALALGFILLSPMWNWLYSRILIVVLFACILWSPLNVICSIICRQAKLGWWLTLIVMITLVLFTLWIVLHFPLSWFYNKWWCRILLFGLAALIILRPMNAVYGLMGTSGSIRLFFVNFVLISLIFSFIYYFGFFKDAGISYDVNQPHIDFQKYAVTAKTDTAKTDSPTIVVSTKRDTVYVEHKLDTTSYTETIIQTRVTRDTLPTFHYQPIDFLQVWRSTILTTLTQESADLLSIATVHNEAMESTNVALDKEKCELFEWILIFHIIISWIFFGVFISLLYNKFRYES